VLQAVIGLKHIPFLEDKLPIRGQVV
jgi:hypothetical protein